MPSDLQITNLRALDGTAGLVIADSTGQVTGTLGSGTVFPAGHVLQVKSTIVTARNSSTDIDTNGTGADVGLNVTITPKQSGSHFLITCSVGIGTTGGETWAINLSRDGTKIGNGVDVSVRKGVWFRGVDTAGGGGNDGNHNVGVSKHYLDTTGSTAGSAITFKCGLITQNNTAYINRSLSDTDNVLAYGSYTSSNVTVMEIAQ